jgi:hypothetical protein
MGLGGGVHGKECGLLRGPRGEDGEQGLARGPGVPAHGGLTGMDERGASELGRWGECVSAQQAK